MAIHKKTTLLSEFLIEEEETNNLIDSPHLSHSFKSSSDSEASEFKQLEMVPISRTQRFMLKRMMKILLKMVSQLPELVDLRKRLRSVKTLRTTLVNVSRPSMETTLTKITEKSCTCPVSNKIYDSIFEMIIFSIMNFHDLHIKAQLKDQTVLSLYYEVKNSDTFPCLGPKNHFLLTTPIPDCLDLYETKMKILSLARLGRNLPKSGKEFDSLTRRVSFTTDELERLEREPSENNFCTNETLFSKPELFQFRLIRALIQNIFAFEKITNDTLEPLFPTYRRDLLSPINKLKSMNFLKKHHFNQGNLSHGTYRKILAKYQQKFEKICKENELFRSNPMGAPLTFDDMLIESEGEIDYEVENNAVSRQLKMNPNLLPEEKLCILLYNKAYQGLLSKIDHLGQSGLFALYPGSVSTFPARACYQCIERLAMLGKSSSTEGEPPKNKFRLTFRSIVYVLRLGGQITNKDFENLTGLLGTS